MYKKDADAFVGGKSGIFKGIKIEQKACIAKNLQNFKSLTKDHEVTVMSWGDQDEREVLLGCGASSERSVRVYDTKNSSFVRTFICDEGEGKINGISRYGNGILTAVESGHIHLWRSNGDNELLIESSPDLHRMRHSVVNNHQIATGGKEHKLQLFDLEKKMRIFEEKNVRHDWLEMRVPLWISDIGFLNDSSLIATCSRYGHVRLYDPNAQRRPVVNLEIKDQALITLAVAPRPHHIVVGSGKGIMNLVDLRKPGKILNTYKDFVGGITSIACPKYNPYIVSVALDRYLRVHDLNTKQLLQKVYLTSRLSCLLLRSGFTLNTNDKINNQSNDDEEEIVVEDESDNNNSDNDAVYNEFEVNTDSDDETSDKKKRKLNTSSDDLKFKKAKKKLKKKIIN